MTLIVFAGPSLAPGPPPRKGFDFRGPAACGDILRAVREKPRAIGLIDGLFETTAAPWHKEILFALSRGIAVFGAASMGALRAAEMAPFGMRGVGAIFEACRSGAIERDDEVAVIHGPAELGWPPLSVALVDVRATLDAAVGARVIGLRAARELTGIAGRHFYKDRTWETVLADAARLLPPRAAARLASWLPSNVVDAKRRDAEAMIAAMARWAARSGTVTTRPDFVETRHFARLVRESAQRR